jgi:hypothetical protein
MGDLADDEESQTETGGTVVALLEGVEELRIRASGMGVPPFRTVTTTALTSTPVQSALSSSTRTCSGGATSVGS